MRIALDHRTLRIAGIAALLFGGIIPGPSTAQARQGAAQVCATATTPPVTYLVGPRGSPPQGVSPGAGVQSGTVPAYPFGFPGYLSGTLTLQAPPGCSTSGAFLVHSTVRPLPLGVQQPGTASSSRVVLPAIFGTSVLTATGSFVQDPMHVGDPTYVLLMNTTVTYGRIQYGCLSVCPQSKSGAPKSGAAIACTPARCGMSLTTVVTGVVNFSSVTGYLHWLPDPAGAAPLSIGLAFLPPPAATTQPVTTTMTLQPVSFVGIRPQT